jgi:hypothetical protein
VNILCVELEVAEPSAWVIHPFDKLNRADAGRAGQQLGAPEILCGQFQELLALLLAELASHGNALGLGQEAVATVFALKCMAKQDREIAGSV